MKFRIIRSHRKTMSLEIRDEEIIVRAPVWATRKDIDRFVESHKSWIEKRLAIIEERKALAESLDPLTKEELDTLREEAKKHIPERVAHYASIIGVTYGNITIRCQKTRWGSCSAKGNLNFNCLLMLTPPEVIDSVVVHELCHRKEMNHSGSFYAEVIKAFPEYRKWDKWLKENGRNILMRVK